MIIHTPDIREIEGSRGRVRLSRFESLVFAALTRSAGRLVTRDAIMAMLYDDRPSDPPQDNSLDVLFYRLRAKLTAADADASIENVRGEGWVFRAQAISPLADKTDGSNKR